MRSEPQGSVSESGMYPWQGALIRQESQRTRWVWVCNGNQSISHTDTSRVPHRTAVRRNPGGLEDTLNGGTMLCGSRGTRRSRADGSHALAF